MMTLKFADSQNTVAFLTKSVESEGFDQIATVKMKTIIGEVQLQALVDGKKIIINATTLRRDLQLEDAEGIDCLPNADIFEQLTLIGSKTTAWNEFSSTMASAIICLATNQKFNFSKYIFESMVKNLDNAGKFLMYPRFVQVFLDNQLEGMATHNMTYIAPSYTKKIFTNMRRQGKDFSGRVTPLFPTMMVQAQEEMGEGLEMPNDPHHTPIITQPSSSQPQRKQKYKRSKRKDAEAPQPSDPTHVADEDVNEEPRGLRTHKLRRLYKVGRSARVVSSEEASLGDQEDASKHGRKIDDIDADVEITLVDETQGRHNDDLMFDTGVLNDEEVFAGHDMAKKEVSIADPVTTTGEVVTTANVAVSTACTIPVSATTITEDEITLAQALAELKKPRESRTTTITTIPSKDKGKGIMVEEPLMMKKKDQINFDEQEAIRLQAEFDEEIDVDYQLDQRLQAEEQQELSIKDKSKLFVQLLEARKRHFAAKRAEEKRNRPPTKSQQRSIMCTYLKNMAGWKPKDLKNKSFANIQELFDKAIKRVNTFIDMDTELVEGSKLRAEGSETREESSSKRAGDELEQEKEKKQKVDEDK
ncbi:hypothetical protein Tco_1303019 [Tanacetum coccineum]